MQIPVISDSQGTNGTFLCEILTMLISFYNILFICVYILRKGNNETVFVTLFIASVKSTSAIPVCARIIPLLFSGSPGCPIKITKGLWRTEAPKHFSTRCVNCFAGNRETAVLYSLLLRFCFNWHRIGK